MSERKKPARWRTFETPDGSVQHELDHNGVLRMFVTEYTNLDGKPNEWGWAAIHGFGLERSPPFPTAESALADARRWWKANGT